jgi:hypothetical protein
MVLATKGLLRQLPLCILLRKYIYKKKDPADYGQKQELRLISGNTPPCHNRNIPKTKIAHLPF